MSKGTKNKTYKKLKWQKGKIIAIAVFIISAIATIVITWFSEDIRYIFPPKIVIKLDATWAGNTAIVEGSKEEIQNYKSYNSCFIKSYIDNNSNDAIIINNITVVVEEFIDYMNIQYTEYATGGKGDTREPYAVDAKLESMETKADAKPQDKNKYLVVNGHDAELVALFLYPEDKGLYKIHLEYTIAYHGKTHVIKTNSQKFLYMFESQEEFDQSYRLQDEDKTESNKNSSFLTDITDNYYTYLDIDQDGKDELITTNRKSSIIKQGLEDAITAERVSIYSVSQDDFALIGTFGTSVDIVSYNAEMKCLQTVWAGCATIEYIFGKIENGNLICKTLTIDLDNNLYYYGNGECSSSDIISPTEAQFYIDTWEVNRDYLQFEYIK